MATENLKIRVTSDSSQAKKDMGGFDDKMKSTIKSVASLAIAMVALKKTYDFFAQATKMAMEQEKIFNTLKNTVKLTGEAWGGAETELDNLFASLQATTVYGDTETAAVFQKLTLLTGDYQTAMEGLPIVLDMAASGFFDLNSSARYVGMALTGNIEMLGRYFSEFKAANNEQLKSMDASEKAAYALDILKTKLKGLAEGELNTSIGKWTQFKNYWGDLQEAIGDNFLPAIGSVSDVLLPSVKAWTAELKLHENEVNLTSKAYKDLADPTKFDKIKKEISLLNDIIAASETPTLIERLNTLKGAITALFVTAALKPGIIAEAIAGDPDKIDNMKDRVEILGEELRKLKPDVPILELEELFGFDPDDAEILTFTLNLEPFTPEELDKWAEDFEKRKEELGIEELDLQLVDLPDMEEQVKQMSPLLNTFASTASSMLQTVFKSGFDNIVDMFEDLIHRMMADLIVSGILNIITQGAYGGFGFFAGLFHSGGEISNVGGKPVRGASGLDFTVPQGFPNDSFPILVESGEHVSVTPSGQGSRTDELLEVLIKELKNKPVANTVMFDDIGMSRYVDRGKLKREYS